VAMKEFLKSRIKPKKGDIITAAGRKIGEHEGVWYYTIGQRRGIGVGGGMPYYVVEKDLKNNILIVARGDKDEALFERELLASEVHWIGTQPELPLECRVVNFQFPISNFQLNSNDKNPKLKTVKVIFKNKQRAITPGQFIVFYDGDVCLGGGKIL